jgi:hypothetical protein
VQRLTEGGRDDVVEEGVADPISLHHAVVEGVLDVVGVGDQAEVWIGARELLTQLVEPLVGRA